MNNLSDLNINVDSEKDLVYSPLFFLLWRNGGNHLTQVVVFEHY